MKTCIDLSQYNRVIDDDPRADGVILRLGFTGYGSNRPSLDKTFEKNFDRYKECVPVGVYYVTLATTPDAVRRETDFVKEELKGRFLQLPLWVDVEAQSHHFGWTFASKRERSEAVALWCETMESAGYYVGVYANKYWFDSMLDTTLLSPFDKWVAQYNKKCTYTKTPFGMWQFTSKGDGRAHGIDGHVDISYMYKDYPTIIKNKGLNGWG